MMRKQKVGLMPFEVPTADLWKMAVGYCSTAFQDNPTWRKDAGRYAGIVSGFLPGITFSEGVLPPDLRMVIDRFIIPAIQTQKPALALAVSDAAARKMCGDFVFVEPLRPCKGREWKQWEKITPAGDLFQNDLV